MYKNFLHSDKIKVELSSKFKIQHYLKIQQNEINTSEHEQLNDNEFLNEILNKIQNNKLFFKIKECNKYSILKNQPIHRQMIDKIESKLKSNSSQQFLDDFILCKIAYEAYCFENNFLELEPYGWHIFEIFKVTSSKLKINIFLHVNEEKGQFVMSFNGSLAQFEMKQFLESEPSEYTKPIIDFFFSLFFYLKHCVDLCQSVNYNLWFTGYAFSSFFADWCVFVCHKYLNEKDVRAVTFESFGTKQCLEKLNSIVDGTKKINLNDLNIKTFFIEKPNFFNSCGKHIGKMFVIKVPGLENESDKDSKYYDFRLKGLDSINVNNLKKILNNIGNKDNISELEEWPVLTSEYPAPSVKINYSELKHLLKLLITQYFRLYQNEFNSFRKSFQHLIQSQLYFLYQLFYIGRSLRNRNVTISGQEIFQKPIKNKS